MLFPKRNKITVIFICRTRRLPPSPPARSSTCRENHNPRPRTRCGRRPGRAPPRTRASRLGLPVSRRPWAACLAGLQLFESLSALPVSRRPGSPRPRAFATSRTRGSLQSGAARLAERQLSLALVRSASGKGPQPYRTTRVGISIALDTSQARSGSLKELAS